MLFSNFSYWSPGKLAKEAEVKARKGRVPDENAPLQRVYEPRPQDTPAVLRCVEPHLFVGKVKRKQLFAGLLKRLEV